MTIQAGNIRVFSTTGHSIVSYVRAKLLRTATMETLLNRHPIDTIMM